MERRLVVPLREAEAVITHDPMPGVLADPAQLAQLFSNLINNAIMSRPLDHPLRTHVGARSTNGFWEFSVSDIWIGIAPECYDRIFLIFQRLHTKETSPITGIGLAIAKSMIDRNPRRVGDLHLHSADPVNLRGHRLAIEKKGCLHDLLLFPKVSQSGFCTLFVPCLRDASIPPASGR